MAAAAAAQICQTGLTVDNKWQTDCWMLEANIEIGRFLWSDNSSSGLEPS